MIQTTMKDGFKNVYVEVISVVVRRTRRSSAGVMVLTDEGRFLGCDPASPPPELAGVGGNINSATLERVKGVLRWMVEEWGGDEGLSRVWDTVYDEESDVHAVVVCGVWLTPEKVREMLTA